MSNNSSNTDKTFIVSQASAGSGKTFTLAKTFIKLAFDAPSDEALKSRFTHILAITFTNKATNEMKKRIVEYLKEMSEDPAGCEITGPLKDELKIDETELKRKAGIVHKAILHNYSDLSVCTIDSFMQRVVRTFAHDLKIPMNFEVSIDYDRIIQEVVDGLMMSLGEGGETDLNKLLTEFVEKRMEDDKSTNIENEITQFCKKLFEEDAPKRLEKIKGYSFGDFAKIEDTLRKKNERFREKVAECAKIAMEACESLERDNFYGNGRGTYDYIKKLSIDDNETFQKDPPKTLIKILYSKDPKDQQLAKNNCNEEKRNYIEKTVKTLFRDVVDKLTSGKELYNSRKKLMKNLFSLALLNELNSRIQDYYSEKEIIHNSEFGQRISEVIKKEEMPFVYERLGTHYWNYLIDEFQDTSRLQWHNLLPLVENAVSENKTTLIVGDGKQAIYRFRQGDARQFVILPKVEDDNGNVIHNFEDHYVPTPLDTNYRSFKNIISFNNEFYYWTIRERFGSDTDKNNTELQKTYIGDDTEVPENSALWQKSSKNNDGYVELQFLSRDDKKEEKYYKAIYEIVKSQREKGYEYKDICIITNKNKDLAAICQYLSTQKINDQDIPMVSSESFLLDNSRVVQLLISILRYLNNYNDRASATEALALLQQLGVIQKDYSDLMLDEQPRQYINEAGKKSRFKTLNLSEILKKEAGINLPNKLQSMSIYECCEELIHLLNLDGKELDDIEAKYTASFLNITAAYSQTNHQDLAAFLKWYDEEHKSFSAKTSDDMDAIKLLTVHKAKGLQSPIIIYMIMPPKSRGKEIWIDIDDDKQKDLGLGNDTKTLPIALTSFGKDEATIFDDAKDCENGKKDIDDINVLYVATTRPEHKLFVVAEEPTTKDKETKTDKASLLYDFARLSHFMEQKDNAPIYCKGDDHDKIGSLKEEDKTKTVTISQISYGNWENNRIKIVNGKQKEADSADDARRHGIAVHDILSKINTAADIETAIGDYFKYNTLPDEEKESIRQEVTAVVTNPDCQRFFANGNEVICESEIMHEGKTHRIDRMVVNDGHAYVIDFKTGWRDKKHHEQVRDYCDLIKQMGYTSVEGYLIYVDNNKVEVVPVAIA